MAATAKKKTASPKAEMEPGLKDRAVDAALDLSETLGWDMVTLTDIADEAGAGLADLREVFEDKTDILAAYGRRLDREVLAAVGTAGPETTERDRLFEVFMERFDRLNDRRAAVLSILSCFKGDPAQAAISLPHLGRSMSWMLEAAGAETKGMKGGLRILGATTLYLAVLREWMKDESADLARTMASLYKNLDRLEKIAGFIKI